MAYLEFVKTSKYTYVYITEYKSVEAGFKRKEKRLFALGDLSSAYRKLEFWQSNKDKVPVEIDNPRIEHWMNKVHSRGRVAF